MKVSAEKICSSAILLTILSTTTINIDALNWQDLVQPQGTLVRVWETSGSLPFPIVQPPNVIPPFANPTTPVEEVNVICAQLDLNVTPATSPFDLNTAVTEIILTQPDHFVRLYAPATGSGPNGAWIMRSSEVRGLTPEQLRDKFALPNVPTNIVNVDLPASPDPTNGKNYALWTGIAGPIAGWGNGGGVQSRIIADFNGTTYFPNYTFVRGIRDHQQIIENFALAYTPMAGVGNIRNIAAYLDLFNPQPFSDLYNVYTILDYINWPGYGPDPLREALAQFSPERYEAIPFVITRNALLFSNTLLDHHYPLKQCLNACGCATNCEPDCSDYHVWIQGVGEFGDQKSEDKHPGFDYKTGGIIAAADFQTSQDVLISVSAAGFDNSVDFAHDSGSALIRSAKLGLYASYSPSWYFIDGLVSGGYNWTSARRKIGFPFDRTAHSRQRGYDLEAHFQTGFNWAVQCWWVTPLVRASYFFVRQNHFEEDGAKSLDLNVRDFDNRTLRALAGIGIARNFDLGCGQFIPQLQLGYAYDYILDNREIKAGLKDHHGTFTVVGYNRDRNIFLAGAKGLFLFANGIYAEAQYDAELEKSFVSQIVRLSVNWNF